MRGDVATIDLVSSLVNGVIIRLNFSVRTCDFFVCLCSHGVDTSGVTTKNNSVSVVCVVRFVTTLGLCDIHPWRHYKKPH